jgi:hypothetical protein
MVIVKQILHGDNFMIFPEFEVDELIDAQLICRRWHAINTPERATLKTFNPLNIRSEIRQVIEVLDPETYVEIFKPTLQ